MTVQAIKQFLKPDWKKVLVAIACFVVSLFLTIRVVDLQCPPGIYCSPVADSLQAGFPLKLVLRSSINYPQLFANFIVDIFFWYLLSCFSAFRKLTLVLIILATLLLITTQVFHIII